MMVFQIPFCFFFYGKVKRCLFESQEYGVKPIKAFYLNPSLDKDPVLNSIRDVLFKLNN